MVVGQQVGETQFLYALAVGTHRRRVTAELCLGNTTPIRILCPKCSEALPEELGEGLGGVYQRM